MDIEFSKQLAKLIDRFVLSIPDTPDQVLLILKTHLLVEQQMNDFLKAQLPNPDAILKKKPRFIHKLNLLRALIPEPSPTDLWDMLEELNSIRNRIAHKLSPENVQSLLHDLVLSVLKHKPPEYVTDFKRVRIGLSVLVALLAFFKEHLHPSEDKVNDQNIEWSSGDLPSDS